MLVDIDVPPGSQIVHVTRPDGSTTVSVPIKAFQAAVEVFDGRIDAITRHYAADQLVADVNRVTQ